MRAPTDTGFNCGCKTNSCIPQLSHTQLSVRLVSLGLATFSDEFFSRKDKNTAQSEVTRWAEASLAAIREAMVRGLHDADHRELPEGWHQYGWSKVMRVICIVADWNMQDSLLSTSTRDFLRTPRENSPVHGPFWLDLERE